MERRRLTAVIGVALAVGATTIPASCGARGSGAASRNGRVRVAAAFYPLQEAVERIGGRRVDVLALTPPGGEPHDLQLTPKTLTQLEGADAVVYLSKGFQPTVEKAVADLPDSVVKLDALRGLPLRPVTTAMQGTRGRVDGEQLEGGFDPHVWVDPTFQARIATSIERMLARVDPRHADEFRTAAATYIAGLDALDEEFSTALAHCRSRTIVTTHRAFAYLSARYHLAQVAIAGMSPDEEPDPRTLQAVAQEARTRRVRVIFFERSVPENLAQTVAREIGARVGVLDPVETISRSDLDRGADYASAQRGNLRSLVSALGCRR